MAVLALAPLLLQALPAHPPADPARRFAALVATSCLRCHGAAGSSKGGLTLVDRAAALRGGDSGPAVTLGEGEPSLLATAVGYGDEFLQMPPDGRLSGEDQQVVLDWIEAGAPEFGPLPVDGVGRAEDAPSEPGRSERILQGDGREGWAYAPLARSTGDSPAATIDALLERELAASGIDPAPRASDHVLVRRLYHTLIGLPPTPEAVAAFVADPAPDKFAAKVRELHASPHYGERFGRHWLDVVRYADTNGFERDADKPHIWRYRDWVIDAFHRDLPYERFVLEQLAGDELADAGPDALIASGFLRLMQWDDEPGAGALQGRFDVLDDIASTTAQAFLATTIGCARCHDHKADPVSQHDYASFVGIFNGLSDMTSEGSLVDVTPAETRALQAPILAAIEAERAGLEERAAAMRDGFLAKLDAGAIRGGERFAEIARESPERFEEMFALHGEAMLGRGTRKEWAGLRKQREELEARVPPREYAFCARTMTGDPPPMHVHVRGNASLPGDRVEPGVPGALHPAGKAGGADTPHRTALARWITAPDNALAARVIVNRVWQWHFGRGLVATSNDFGELGARPSHPELLDWLAAYFVETGGSIKTLSGTILSTRAWQRASTFDGAAFERDPENRLLWRHSPRRMSAEEVRDALLFVSGMLSETRGGPPVFGRMPLAARLTASRPAEVWGGSTPEERNRRTVYLKVKRSLLPPFLVAHDFADVDASCPERFTSILPTQALQMLNGSFTHEVAAALAARVEREAVPGTVKARIERAIRLAFGREPEALEVAELVALHDELAEELPAVARAEAEPSRALELVCLTILNANEFVFLD